MLSDAVAQPLKNYNFLVTSMHVRSVRHKSLFSAVSHHVRVDDLELTDERSALTIVPIQ